MNQYLTFYVDGEEYAVTILKVTEIIECVSLTYVPGTPPWIRGVLNLRGAVVPVVDLAVKFGLPSTTLTRRTCVVMVELDIEHDGKRMVLGVMADSVNQVVELAPDQIQPPPQDFWTSLYFSASTLLPLSYGEILPIGFVAFNAEEDGLLGSRDFVAHGLSALGVNVRLVHVLEMVGFRDPSAAQHLPLPWVPASLRVPDFLGLIAKGNSNGVVDAADLVVWAASYDANAAGDADGDGDSDGADYLIWQMNLGATSPPATAANVAVPEPAGRLLLACGALALVVARSRRR